MRAGDGLVRQQPTADRTAFGIDIDITDFLHARQLHTRSMLYTGAFVVNAHEPDASLWHVSVLVGHKKGSTLAFVRRRLLGLIRYCRDVLYHHLPLCYVISCW